MPNAATRLCGWPGTLGLVLLVITANLAFVDSDATISGTSLAWSAIGFSTALLALTPFRRWPILLPLTLAVPSGLLVLRGGDPDLALRFGVIESGAALCSALLVRRARGRGPRSPLRRTWCGSSWPESVPA